MNEMLPSFYSGEALTQAQERVDVMMESIRKSIPFAWWQRPSSIPGRP